MSFKILSVEGLRELWLEGVSGREKMCFMGDGVALAKRSRVYRLRSKEDLD